MKKSLIFTALISLCLFAFNHIKADVSADYSLDMNISADYSASLNLNIYLENTSDSSLINAYSIDFPFNVTNVGGSIDGKTISASLTSSTDISNVSIDFQDNLIRPHQKAILKLSVFASNTLKNKFGVEQLDLPFPSSNFSYNSVSTSVTFPNTLGKISYSSEAKYNMDRVDDNSSKLSVNQTSALVVMWGNPQFSVSFDSTLENRKENTNHSLLNLIPEYDNQKLSYVRVPEADYALTDKLNNNFAYLTLEPNSNLKISSLANVTLSDSIDTTFVDKYNWNLNLDSVLGQKIYSQINQASDNYSKLKLVNDFLLSNFDLSSDKIDSSNINDIWNINQKLNQFQYCYLIISTSEYLDLTARIEYGYHIFSEDSSTPAIWCSVNIDSKSYKFDFKTQKNLGLAQIIDSSITDLKMGIWSPNQTYNNMLGILSDSPLMAQFDDPKIIANGDLVPQIRVVFPENVFSGEFYSGNISINNPTSNILKFKDLKVNGNSVLNTINVGELSKAVMPLQENTIKVDYLREDDFILNLSRSIDTVANFDNLDLSTTSLVKFEPDYKLLVVFILILIVTISILIYLISKLIKRKL